MHRRKTDLVHSMVEQLGEKTLSCREIVGLGEVNFVFVAETPSGEWVVRFHRDPLDTDADYEKEAWCLKTMASVGVPVPGFIGRGDVDGVSFIVQEFIEGVNADERRSPELWRTLGGYCRAINDLPLDDSAPDALYPRFGKDLAGNWREHIAYNLAQLTESDQLLTLGAYELRHQDALRRRFSELQNRVETFGLTHGDLVPKNVLISTSGTPVVIDWGSAFTGPSPYSDFNRIWTDPGSERFTAKDLTCFAEGYGLPLESMMETMRDIRLLDRIDVVRWAIDRRPDRVDELVAKAKQATYSWM